MAYAVIAQTSVNVYAAESPSDDEWDTYLEYRSTHAQSIKNVLVYTLGGSATQLQRIRLNRLPSWPVDVPGAVVTSSSYVRAMYRANRYANWRVFSEAEWTGAFHHIGIRNDETRLALFARVATLAKELGIPSPSEAG